MCVSWPNGCWDGHLCHQAWPSGYSGSRRVTRCSQSACSTPYSTPASTSRHLGSRLSRRRCLPASRNGCRRWTCTACPCWSLLVVVGRPIDLEELRRLHSSHAPPSLSGAMARLVDARLVVARDADGDPAYEVSHPLVQECIYAGLDSARAPRAAPSGCPRPDGIEPAR